MFFAASNPCEASDDDGSELYPDIDNDPQEFDNDSSTDGSVSCANNDDEDHNWIHMGTQEWTHLF